MLSKHFGFVADCELRTPKSSSFILFPVCWENLSEIALFQNRNAVLKKEKKK